jgi:hypothetical protein
VDVPTLATAASLLSIVRRLTRAQAGTVYASDAFGLRFIVAQNDEISRRLGHPAAVELFTGRRLPWTQPSIAAYVGLARTAVTVVDSYAIPANEPYAFNPQIDVLTGFRTVSMVTVPLPAPIRGVLQLINATNRDGDILPFSRAAELVVEELARDTARALPR